MPELSSTDVKCLWASKKKDVNQIYTAVPVSDFCHVACTEDSNKENIDTKNTLELLLKACPDSALARCLHKRKVETEVENIEKSPKRYHFY